MIQDLSVTSGVKIMYNNLPSSMESYTDEEFNEYWGTEDDSVDDDIEYLKECENE